MTEPDENPPATPRSIAPATDPPWLKQAVFVVLGFGVLFFCVPLGKSGIWDPFELTVADLSRRIAINVLGAHALTLEGADNSMPRLGDLGRGELPFDSIAVGFRVFGLHEWSGRLPLALWGLVGIVCLYWLLARLIDRRAGLYGAIILTTMPLYFMQARTMLGDIVTMAAISMSFAGLGIATFDRSGVSLGRVLACALGAAGLALGFMTRGLLIGVAIPALGVGFSWGVLMGSSPRARELFGDIAGAAALLVGAVATLLGTSALFRATATEYSMWVGAQIANQSKFPTFDLVIHYLGHSLLPWSAFIPFAVGRLFRSPPPQPGPDESAETRASAVRLLAIVGSAVAIGVY
jgi:4-amino-4-deoxy-L-arabinose transferase-like glycosyltransferase